MEKETTELQKDAKAYLDAMRCKYILERCQMQHAQFGSLSTFIAMSASQSRIAETLELFYTADRTSDVSSHACWRLMRALLMSAFFIIY
jgi:hypothetical protein